MADFPGDQAEGLRRLVGREAVRIITVAAGGCGLGTTSAVINIAAALAGQGRQVLIIDENYGPANVTGLLGMRARFDLQHVMRQTCMVEDALVEGPSGVAILPAANGARSLLGLRHIEQERLIASFGRLGKRFDIVLIDTHSESPGSPGLLGRAADDAIIMSSAAAPSITDAYALIKRMREQPSARRFHVLLNRVMSEPNARLAFDNMQRVAESHLEVTLECLGYVPKDENLRQATQGFQSVIKAYPSSPSAHGFKRIAECISGWPRTRDRHRGLDSFMHRLLLTNRFAFAYAGGSK
jgi:flagellar biosynthesis protein FlhG